MVWPIGSFDVPTVGMDSDSDTVPRDNIHHMANLVNIMRTAVNLPSCPPLLDASGKLDAAVLPIDQRKHYIGEVFALSHGALPYKCLWANGAAVSRIAWPELNALYAAQGYPHGAGDGVTTFQVPDLRARMVMCADGMGEVGPSFRVTQQFAGFTPLLGRAGGDQKLMSHRHPGTISPVGDHVHGETEPVPGDLVGSGGTPINGVRNVTEGYTSPAGAHTHAIDIGVEGGGVAHNIPPVIVLYQCVQG